MKITQYDTNKNPLARSTIPHTPQQNSQGKANTHSF